MPGLVGYTQKNDKYSDDMLLSMRRLLKHFAWYVDDAIYSDRHFHATRTHLGIIDQGVQPFNVNNSLYSWLEGEFYNQEELRAKYRVTSANDNELLLNIYGITKSFDFLRDVDGYYTAVVYDNLESIVYLITDRYGFKPLYWGVINGNLVWSSELKGFLDHNDFKIKIDSVAVVQFFEFGYLLENRTWFEGVELMPPAAVIAFNIRESKTKITNYWTWSEIKLLNDLIDETEIAEELGRLFKESVRKRVTNNERIGITLSGGLDSRAILAAVPDDCKPLHTFTFGQDGCDDIKIAKKAAEIKGAVHHALILNHDNWIQPRIDYVWISDGSYSLLHMHGTEFFKTYKSYMEINLNGFLGDAILGGSYIYRDSSVEYKVRNRGRRFVNSGSLSHGSQLIQRKPFFDNNMFDYIVSIPETLRRNSYIYNKMLLSTFPQYFLNIPWQKTSCPISYPNAFIKTITLKNRVVGRLKREAGRIGTKNKNLRNYTNYVEWIRNEPARSFFEKVLFAKNSIYSEYIDNIKIQSHLKDHLQGKANHHDELCLALTFEIWLQQIFEGRYRV